MPRDPYTLDQIRMFLAVAEAGSFSAAARRTNRAQSAVSFIIASFEQALGLALFARGPRGLALTTGGEALVPRARAVAEAADSLRRVSGDLVAGVEAEVVLAIDMLMPMAGVSRVLAAFRADYPDVDTRLHVEPLGGVAQLLLDRTCALGVIASLPDVPADLVAEPVGQIDIVAVAAPDHALAGLDHWPAAALKPHMQLVVSDRSALSAGREFAVFSERTCRISDLAAKHAMLRAGLGWGAMPLHMVAADLAAGTLVRLLPAMWSDGTLRLPVQLVRHARSALGPAAARMMDLLREHAAIG